MRRARTNRNKAITREVLEGVSMSSVGRVYGLSRARVHQIVYDCCRAANPDRYKSLRSEPGATLALLRQHREEFLG